MSDVKRIFLLICILVIITFTVTGIAITMLFQTAIKQQKERLVETAQSQARLIEAVARFDALYSGSFPESAEKATLTQILDAHANYKGFGETGEFTLARREGQSIIFLLSHRHYDMEQLQPVPFDSEMTEPMRRALSGLSGAMIGLDYRGKKVLAAYEPVAVLNLGIVVKIDLSEVKAPFIRARMISGFFAVLAVALGALLFTLIINPVIRKLRKSEHQNRLLIETMSDGFVMADENGVLTFVNDRFCHMLDYSNDEIIGRSLSDFMDEANQEKYQEQLALRRRGEYGSYEITFSRKDGQRFTVMISPKPLFGAEGVYTGSFGVVTDITRLKQTEEKIRKERDLAESLLETAQAIVLVLDTQGCIVRFNPYLEEFSGYKLKEVQGRDWFETFLPESQRDKTRELFLKAIDDIQTEGNVAPIITRQGVEREIEWHDKTLKDEDGHVIGLLAIGQDITEHLQAAKALQESEEWQRSIFEGSRDAIFISGADAKFVDVNEAAVTLAGYSREELKKMSIPDLHDEEDLAPFKTFFNRIMAGEAITSQGVIRRKDGTKVDTEFSNRRIEVGGKPYMHTTARDITERSQAEAALRDSEMKYRALFESANDAIFLLDLEGNHVAVNKKAADMLGYEIDELVDKSIKDIVAPSEFNEAQGKLQGLIAGKTFPLYERIFRKKDGTEFPVEINVALICDGEGKPLYVQSIVRDITSRKEGEKRVKSALKEKEVLLQEIHHRVKNNMQIISSLLRLQAGSIEGSDTQEMFKESQNRIRSMALIHDKLYKSKNFAQINFAQYIQSLILHLFQTYNIKPNTIKLKTELDNVFLDINRAIPCGLLINEIVSNSLKHAFPENEKGEIRVSLQAHSKDKFNIQIIDDGIGFPENLDFRNPTTLGLQLVNDLVQQIGGTLELDRRKGTKISITF